MATMTLPHTAATARASAEPELPAERHRQRKQSDDDYYEDDNDDDNDDNHDDNGNVVNADFAHIVWLSTTRPAPMPVPANPLQARLPHGGACELVRPQWPACSK